METEIDRVPEPFSDAPALRLPPATGCLLDKPFAWRVPVTGALPISISVEGLPEGTTFDESNGSIVGSAAVGEYRLVVTAKNAFGSDRGETTLTVQAPPTENCTMEKGGCCSMKTKIARAPEPFAGAPALHLPPVTGCSPYKPFLWRVPVTGARPVVVSVEGLPEGMIFDESRGSITGSAAVGEYRLVVTAKNALGTDRGETTLRVRGDGLCPTPLLGWTSWNAFRNTVSDEMIRETARLLEETGLADYGYRYVNIDSGWQGEYGGEWNAVQPNEKFPDMKALADEVHARGLNIGIYSTPMTKAWGGGEYPGCTRNKDHSYIQFIVGEEHYEANNAKQWTEWEIDYLKYDWTPCTADVADLMKRELVGSPRDFAFCATVDAKYVDAGYWRENCTSWRHGPDSEDNWDCVRRVLLSADVWMEHMRPGHFYDLDMLETGYFDGHACALSEDEQLAAYSIRAFLASPIQISCDLSKLTPFDRDMLCNDEILALNQDASGIQEMKMTEVKAGNVWTRIYTRPLSDGSTAAAYFNLGDETADMTLSLDGVVQARDLWAKENLSNARGVLTLTLEPHTVRIVRLRKI